MSYLMSTIHFRGNIHIVLCVRSTCIYQADYVIHFQKSTY
jgi:hypothetical protein